MAVVSKRWDDDWALRSHHNRDSWFDRNDDWLYDWKDWPSDWPQPRDLVRRFERDADRWWRDWPSDWPKFDELMPRFSSQLDRMDRNWRTDPFWRDIYPRWAEPIFKEGIDVNAHIRNDDRVFAVDVDAYQFKPEELQVKTQGDTLLIEGRHEDVKDADNFTKMHFVRRYQLPRDIDPREVTSSIDGSGRLTVEAPRRHAAIGHNERLIPVEGPSKRSASASPRTRHDSGYGRSEFSPRSYDRNTPLTVDPHEHRYDSGRESRTERNRDAEFALDYNRDRDLQNKDYSNQTRREEYSHYSRRSESRTSGHDVTMANENRHYSNGRRTPYEEQKRQEEQRSEPFGSAEQRKEHKSIFDSIRDKFERGFGKRDYREEHERQRAERLKQPQEHDYRGSERRRFSTDRNGYASDRTDRERAESRQAYRVDSPSSYAGSQRNGGLLTTAEPRSGSRVESVRSVQIMRREYR